MADGSVDGNRFAVIKVGPTSQAVFLKLPASPPGLIRKRDNIFQKNMNKRC